MRTRQLKMETGGWRFGVVNYGLVMTLFLGMAASVIAQNFAIDSFTIDGGGGVSRGGAYAVSGTIGQPDAGRMSGGSYQVTGGFWGVVQTPGAPLLRITRSGPGSVRVSWPFPSTGFVLQQTSAMASPPSAIVWPDVTSPTAVHTGSDWTVTIPSPTGNRFFRLRKP